MKLCQKNSYPRAQNKYGFETEGGGGDCRCPNI